MNVNPEIQTVDPLLFYLTGKQPFGKDALAGRGRRCLPLTPT